MFILAKLGQTMDSQAANYKQQSAKRSLQKIPYSRELGIQKQFIRLYQRISPLIWNYPLTTLARRALIADMQSAAGQSQ